MVCAELDRTTIVIDMSGSSQQFVATGEVVRFDGFLRLYSESTDDDQAAESGEGLLPKMAQGDELLSTQITATERFTQAPARYNEASLVKRLEELGIGRPRPTRRPSRRSSTAATWSSKTGRGRNATTCK